MAMAMAVSLSSPFIRPSECLAFPHLRVFTSRKPGLKRVHSAASKVNMALAPSALVLPPRFGLVLLTAAASVVLTQWQGFQVGKQRRNCGLKYPKMYEDTEISVFNCYQRAHQNTLEAYPAYLTLLVLGGLGFPLTSAILGLVWVVGRLLYSLGYYTGDPSKRMRGVFHVFGLLGLLITTCVYGFRLLTVA